LKAFGARRLTIKSHGHLFLGKWLWMCGDISNYSFKYQPILIYISNIVSGFELPDMILTR